MAVATTPSIEYKLLLGQAQVNLASDTLKIILMRSGFTFDPLSHRYLKNVKGTITGASDIDFSATNSTITKSTGGFLAAGFVKGNQITISGTTNNNLTCEISDVTDTVITVTGATLTDETGTSATIVADDEIPTANGYTQEDMTLGTITVSEDSTNIDAVFSFPTVTWTASGGDIGPTAGAIIYDDTQADKVIIGYIDFGADQTATDGATFNITDGEFRVA